MTASGYGRLSGLDASNERLELQAAGEDIPALVVGLELYPSRRILEIGCGSGAVTREIARQHPTSEVVGVDLTHRHIEYATAAAAQAGLKNVRFMRGDGRDPPAQFVGHFDVVMARYVFMYAMADGSAGDLLAGMVRCLRPGGALLLVEADINFGSHMNPPPQEPLASVMREVVSYYRELGSIEWRAGIHLFELLTDAGLEGATVKLLDCRIIQGGHPSALVEHDGKDIETLIAPVVGRVPEAYVAGDMTMQWRRLLGDTRSFIYTPIFLARWRKPSPGRQEGSRQC